MQLQQKSVDHQTLSEMKSNVVLFLFITVMFSVIKLLHGKAFMKLTEAIPAVVASI